MVPAVGTGRALIRSLSSFVQVPAVQAPPGDLLVPGEHFTRLDIMFKSPVALLVLFFGNTDGRPGFGGPAEALFVGNRGKTGI